MACARAGPTVAGRRHRRARRWRARGFEAWWPQEKLAVSGYVEVLRHYREIVGIRNQLRERLLREPPRRLHRRRCARFQPRPRGGAEGARHQDRAFRLSLDLGLARRARRKDQAQRRPRAVHLPVRAANCCAQHGIAATYVGPSAGQRHSDGAGPGRGPARAGSARSTARCSPSCRAAGARRCTISPGASSRRGALMPQGAARASSFVVPAMPARCAASRGRRPVQAGLAGRPDRSSTASRTPCWRPAT